MQTFYVFTAWVADDLLAMNPTAFCYLFFATRYHSFNTSHIQILSGQKV